MIPETSIIIPVYNAEKYIEETILSVLNQTYENWELILINDGSNDNTEGIIQHYLTNTKIHYYRQNNSGVSAARNFGYSQSKGKYISFLDADDVWNSSNLEEKIFFLKKEPIDAVYSNCDLIDENSVNTNKTLTGSKVPSLNDILTIKGNYITAPSGIIFKKEIFDTIGMFDTNLSNNADQDIWIRLLANNFKLELINKSLWKYRVHLNNMSKNISLLEKDSIYLMEKVNKNNLFESQFFKKQCFGKLYYMLAGSWWKNGNNKFRGLYFLLKSIWNYPPITLQIIKK